MKTQLLGQRRKTIYHAPCKTWVLSWHFSHGRHEENTRGESCRGTKHRLSTSSLKVGWNSDLLIEKPGLLRKIYMRQRGQLKGFWRDESGCFPNRREGKGGCQRDVIRQMGKRTHLFCRGSSSQLTQAAKKKGHCLYRWSPWRQFHRG